jgi:hypothetical protein
VAVITAIPLSTPCGEVELLTVLPSFSLCGITRHVVANARLVDLVRTYISFKEALLY